MRCLSTMVVRRSGAAALSTACLALGLALGLAPRPAQAQFFDWGNGWSWGNGASGWGGPGWGNGDRGAGGTGTIYRSLGERGFRVVAPLRRNGDVVVADVIDRRGRRERLILASVDGQILRRFLLNAQPLPRRSAPQPDDLEQQMDQADQGMDAPPVPPAAIPDPGYGDGGGATVIEPLPPRSGQRITVRPPRPRYVERTPDTAQPEVVPVVPDEAPSQPLRLKIRPSVVARPAGAAADRPPSPPTVTASRPADPAPPASPPPTTAAPAVVSATPPTRMRDPLAIPRAAPEAPKPSVAAAEPPRKPALAPAVATPIAAAPKVAAPAKGSDVPVAPLD